MNKRKIHELQGHNDGILCDYLLLNCLFTMEVWNRVVTPIACVYHGGLDSSGHADWHVSNCLQSGNGSLIDAMVGGGQIFLVMSSCVSLFFCFELVAEA